MIDKRSEYYGDIRRILWNSATLIATRSITKIGTTLLVILIARKLGDGQFGVFSSLTAFVSLFGILTEFGLTVPLIRTLAQRAETPGDMLGRVILIKVVLGVCSILLLAVGALTFRYSLNLALLFGASMFFEMQAMSVTRSFEGFEQMHYVALLTTIERGVLCALGFIVLYAGMGLMALGAVYVITYVVVFISGLILFVRRAGPIRFGLTASQFSSTLRIAAPFVIAGLFSVLYNRMDIYVITLFRPSSEIGWYNAAFRIIDAQMFLPMAIVSAIFPVLARYYQTAPERFLPLFKRSFLLLFVLGLGLSAITYAIASPLIRLLYGDQYLVSAEFLKVLSPMLCFYFLNLVVGSSLIALGREELSTWTLIGGAVISCILMFLLVPAMHGLGAAIARVLTEVAAFSLQIFYFVRVVHSNRLARLSDAEGVLPK